MEGCKKKGEIGVIKGRKGRLCEVAGIGVMRGDSLSLLLCYVQG